jgi:hypothetical protein
MLLQTTFTHTKKALCDATWQCIRNAGIGLFLYGNHPALYCRKGINSSKKG